ncbi:unnamed protein product [Laminaria digitata]
MKIGGGVVRPTYELAHSYSSTKTRVYCGQAAAFRLFSMPCARFPFFIFPHSPHLGNLLSNFLLSLTKLNERHQTLHGAINSQRSENHTTTATTNLASPYTCFPALALNVVSRPLRSSISSPLR